MRVSQHTRRTGYRATDAFTGVTGRSDDDGIAPRAVRPELACVLALAALAGPASAQVPEPVETTPSASTLADRLWDELEALPWGRTCEAWSESRPGAACRPWMAASRPIGPEEEWCARGDDPELLGTLYFYGLEPEDPVACRFGRYRAGIEAAMDDSDPSPDSLGRAELRAVARELEDRLTSVYGEPSRPSVGEVPGMAYGWSSIRRWRTDRADLFLFIVRDLDARVALGLAARGEPLARAIARSDTVTGSLAARIRREAIRTLIADGPSAFPRTERLLRDRDVGAWSGDDADDAVAAVSTLLAAADTLPTPLAGTALLVADRLVDRIGGWMTKTRMAGVLGQPADTAKAVSLGARLDTLGLGLAWNELGAVWHSPRPLLWRVWREHPETRAGEYAFLQLLLAGWDTSFGCVEGSDAFRPVIERSRAFLDDRPESPLRGYIAYAVATAYETWWSLSRAPDDAVYVDARAYREGANEARRRAIAFYEMAIRDMDSALERDDAVRRVARLHRGVDTRQRGYFCIYD